MCPVPMDQRARLRKSAEIFIREGICQREVPKVLHDKVCPFSQLFVAAGQRCCKDRLTAFWSQTKKHHLFGNRSKRQGRGKGVSDLVISIRPEDKCLVRRQHDFFFFPRRSDCRSSELAIKLISMAWRLAAAGRMLGSLESAGRSLFAPDSRVAERTCPAGFTGWHPPAPHEGCRPGCRNARFRSLVQGRRPKQGLARPGRRETLQSRGHAAGTPGCRVRQR